MTFIGARSAYILERWHRYQQYAIEFHPTYYSKMEGILSFNIIHPSLGLPKGLEHFNRQFKQNSVIFSVIFIHFVFFFLTVLYNHILIIESRCISESQ